VGTRAEEMTTPADIEATRAELTRDIDELGDKVSPRRVVQRQKEATRGRLGSLRDKVMGTAQDARQSMGGTASGTASGVAGSARGALGSLESRAEGNPLAAGLVAFGAGMLISAMIPASETEARAARRAVDAAKEHGGPVADEARSVAQDAGQQLKESATEAAQDVRSTAQESAQRVQEEGKSSAQNVKDQASG